MIRYRRFKSTQDSFCFFFLSLSGSYQICFGCLCQAIYYTTSKTSTPGKLSQEYDSLSKILVLSCHQKVLTYITRPFHAVLQDYKPCAPNANTGKDEDDNITLFKCYFGRYLVVYRYPLVKSSADKQNYLFFCFRFSQRSVSVPLA